MKKCLLYIKSFVVTQVISITTICLFTRTAFKMKKFLDAMDTTNKVHVLLSQLYVKKVTFNDFFWFVCTIALVPFAYYCQRIKFYLLYIK